MKEGRTDCCRFKCSAALLKVESEMLLDMALLLDARLPLRNVTWQSCTAPSKEVGCPPPPIRPDGGGGQQLAGEEGNEVKLPSVITAWRRG